MYYLRQGIDTYINTRTNKQKCNPLVNKSRYNKGEILRSFYYYFCTVIMHDKRCQITKKTRL